ncbi:MAG: dTMP kinase [bacterium]|nr:dTMP kinase [Gammaproteobacteria bacterium]HIL97135.1 dTMP kinase [Pseudomonadales bacterium]
MSKGRFITIEGVEGVGKSTNIELIESLLDARGISHITTREPGGTQLSEKVRTLLLDKHDSNMCDMTELLLMFAARTQHVQELIKPALENGDWVICDRFTDSSYAYQGAGREMGKDPVAVLEKIALADFRPDMTLLLDLPVAVGLERAKIRGEFDRIESAGIEFFIRVRQCFLDRAAQSDRFRVIDANQSLDKVQAQISKIVQTCIRDWQE